MATIINLMYTTPIALFAGADEDEYQIDLDLGPVSLNAAIIEAKELLNRPHITSVLGWDTTTGEILFTMEEEIEDMEEIPEDFSPLGLDDYALECLEHANDCDPDWEPADIDDDCGFDPYMGCYTDDC